jgi:N-acetylmuramoyl-L-alanine amidase
MAMGNDILDLAKKHIGEKYILGALVPKDNSKWKGPWDCAEFISWCVYQVSSKLYGCNRDTGDPSTADAYTGFWIDDAKDRGLIIPVQRAIETPGAALVRKPRPSKIGHIVISDGNEGTVEAHSAKKGVIAGKTTGRVWDMGILVPFIDYTAVPGASPHTPPATIYRLTMPMMKGSKVEAIQRELESLGFDPGDIDGWYGPKTAAAVLAFQLSQGDLVADGEVGPLTAAALGITFP